MFTRLIVILLCFGVTFLGPPPETASTPVVHAFHDLLIPQPIVHAFTPAQLATAYDFNALYRQKIDGSGQTVALIEIDSYNPADLAVFDTTYDLPAPNLRQYYAGGVQFPLDDGSETTYDLEWLHGLAPGASIQIYYVDSNHSLAVQWQSMAAALHAAAAIGAGIVSISLGACRAGRNSVGTQQAIASLFHQGISVFVSSGDDGDHPGAVQDCGNSVGVAYPGSDPYAVSVGGTSLHLQTSDVIARETAWKWSGGGRVVRLSRRPWQTAPGIPKGKQRWAPDVSFLADPSTGVNYLWDDSWHQGGGTSLGAPAWAAAWALIQQDAGVPTGPAGRLLYRIGNSNAYPSAFHDVVKGSNGTYHAGPGWDPVTGWGTPDVSSLAASVKEIVTGTAAR